MKKELNELKENLIKSGKDLCNVFLSIGRIIREAYFWAADLRMKAPRVSFGVEIVIFAITILMLFVNYKSKIVWEQDNSMARHYKLEKMYEDSLQSVEASAFLRGIRTIRDSIKDAKLIEQPKITRTIKKKVNDSIK